MTNDARALRKIPWYLPREYRSPSHCFNRYSRGRYLAQRTGVDLRGKSPQRVAQHLFECSKEDLAAMRSGAFFVVCDEFSKTSAVFRMLTETNIAMPVEQFFGAEDFASLADSQGALDAAVRTYVTEERVSQEYQANRDKLVVSVSTVTGMATSLMLVVQGGALEVALVSAKNVLGNCQVLANLSDSFRISWPKEMQQLMIGLKVVTKIPLSAFRSMTLCARAHPPPRARVC